MRTVEPRNVERWSKATQLLDGLEDCGTQGSLSAPGPYGRAAAAQRPEALAAISWLLLSHSFPAPTGSPISEVIMGFIQ